MQSQRLDSCGGRSDPVPPYPPTTPAAISPNTKGHGADPCPSAVCRWAIRPRQCTVSETEEGRGRQPCLISPLVSFMFNLVQPDPIGLLPGTPCHSPLPFPLHPSLSQFQQCRRSNSNPNAAEQIVHSNSPTGGKLCLDIPSIGTCML